MQINSYIFCNDVDFYKDILEKIPDKPRIPIDNYMLDLIDVDDGKEKSIYLNNASKIIQEIWEEIIENNWKKLKIRTFIPTNLGITPSVLYSYKNGKKNISISTMYNVLKIWKKTCNKTEMEFKEKWNFIYNSGLPLSTHSKCQKTSLPRFINPKLSYLLGWICGDGNLQKSGNHYLIKISEKSREQLELILRSLFIEIFGVFPPIFLRYGNGYALQIGSKPIFRFLKNVIRIKVGEIPLVIYSFDPINKKYFLMGLFDAEGSVASKYLDSRITITQSDKAFLEKVIELFKEINIQFNGPYFHKNNLGQWYHIQIRRKSEILKYAQNVGSCHIEKVKKIQKLVNKIEEKWNC